MILIEKSTKNEIEVVKQGEELSYNLKDGSGIINAGVNARIFGDTLEICDFIFSNEKDAANLFKVVWHHAMEKGIARMITNSYDENKTAFLKKNAFAEVYREGSLCHLKKELMSVQEYVREYVLKAGQH